MEVAFPLFSQNRVCGPYPVRLTPEGEPAGGYLIAIDTVGAGPGQTVLINDEGGGAQQVLGCPGAPIRSVVVGIIDE